MFDHLSYSKEFVNIIHVVCDVIYCQKYFKHGLSFYIFAVTFKQDEWSECCDEKSVFA